MNGVVGRLKANHLDKLPDGTQGEDVGDLQFCLNPGRSHDSVAIKACT